MEKFLLTSIRLYQKTGWFHKNILRVFFLSNQSCKFTPTCSEYSYQTIEKYGAVKGGWLAIRRISRCRPGSRGGYDPVL